MTSIEKLMAEVDALKTERGALKVKYADLMDLTHAIGGSKSRLAKIQHDAIIDAADSEADSIPEHDKYKAFAANLLTQAQDQEHEQSHD